jgi:hypothetical protein
VKGGRLDDPPRGIGNSVGERAKLGTNDPNRQRLEIKQFAKRKIIMKHLNWLHISI